MSMSYKDTVFLPKTDFSMKGDLAKKEPEILKTWNNLYQRLRKRHKEQFTLLFGPPYANGNIHIGHALSYTLKDLVNKTYQMMGYDAPMIIGWDSHGLPIEWKVEEEYRKKNLSKNDIKTTEQILKFRQDCREFASHWMSVQREELKRLGIIANFDQPYNTMDFDTEGEIVAQMSHFLLNGTLYQGLRPILWSVVEQTSLADNETEYKTIKSPSIYVGFPIQGQDVYAVIWTTTPWTLPANRAISYNANFDYIIIQLADQSKALIAKDLLEPFIKAAGQEYTFIRNVSKKELASIKCRHPLYKKGYTFEVPFLNGDHVTLDAGTGLVHTAPGHGAEDFTICQKYNIKVPHLISSDGFYFDDVPLFAKEHIFKVNPKIIEALKEEGCLFAENQIEHSYPHSWRSKKPLIYMVTPQWFINIKDIRPKALEEIEKVEWFPSIGKNRIRSMVETRPDWCISRQRFWGTPLAIFMHKKTKEPLRDHEVQQRIIDLIRKEGGDVWYTKDASFFLGEKYSDQEYEKVFDVLDVWFDSGCVHQFVAQKRLKWPADVVLEGSDQHRGWFQSMLLESVGTKGTAPFKKVVTHGFVLDEHGYKMSKSQGNIVAPQKIMEDYGADILRQWVVFADYTEDLRIGSDIIKRQQDLYRRFRNTLRYLLGALCDFSENEIVKYKDLPELEQYILHETFNLKSIHEESVTQFKYSKFYEALHHFCANDLSSFYFDIRKDSLYCDAKDSIKRRSARTVMYYLLQILTRYLAPVLSFTAEEVYQNFTKQTNTSVHELLFFDIPNEWNNKVLAEKWKRLRDIRRVITGALEVERANKVIGSSLEATVELHIEDDINSELLNEISITSSLYINALKTGFQLEDIPNVYCRVSKAIGYKCERCWKISPTASNVKKLCERCESIIG